MFIKFDELELFEFFESEAATIGEYEEGNWLYSLEKNNFEIILLIATYEMYIEVSISYIDNIIYSQRHDNIIEIRKIDTDNLKVITDKEKTIILKKEPQLGIIVE